MRLSSPAEIKSVVTEEFAMTLMSLLAKLATETSTSPATMKIWSAFVDLVISRSPDSKMESRPQDQGIRIPVEASWVLQRVKSGRISGIGIAVHEMPFNFEIPVPVQVQSSADHFVINVIPGLAGVS